MLDLCDGYGEGLTEVSHLLPSQTFWEHWDIHCRECVGYVSNLFWLIGCVVYGTLSSIKFPFAFSKVPHEWCLNHDVRPPIYSFCLCWMWLETFLFDWCTFSLSNTLSWGRQDWCLLTVRIGGIGMVLVLVLVLVIIVVPFSAWIVDLSRFIEDAQVWFIAF